MAINVEDGAARRDAGLFAVLISDDEPQIGLKMRRGVPLGPLSDMLAARGSRLLQMPLYSSLRDCFSHACPSSGSVLGHGAARKDCAKRPASHLAICAAIGGPNTNWSDKPLCPARRAGRTCPHASCAHARVMPPPTHSILESHKANPRNKIINPTQFTPTPPAPPPPWRRPCASPWRGPWTCAPRPAP